MKLSIIFFVIIVLSFTGCSWSTTEKVSRFNNVDEAVSYGMKQENVKKDNIIGKIQENGEIFIIYKKELEDGLGVGVAQIIKKNSQFSWYRPDAYVLVENNNFKNFISEISWNTETESGKKFVIYTGIVEQSNQRIKVSNGEVTPKVDKSSGIYFYIESIE